MTGTPIHERLYALAAQSEPDVAAELTACADVARAMLEALELAAERLEISNYEGEEDPFLATVKAAIAKAKGGST